MTDICRLTTVVLLNYFSIYPNHLLSSKIKEAFYHSLKVLTLIEDIANTVSLFIVYVR